MGGEDIKGAGVRVRVRIEQWRGEREWLQCCHFSKSDTDVQVYLFLSCDDFLPSLKQAFVRTMDHYSFVIFSRRERSQDIM